MKQQALDLTHFIKIDGEWCVHEPRSRKVKTSARKRAIGGFFSRHPHLPEFWIGIPKAQKCKASDKTSPSVVSKGDSVSLDPLAH